MLYINKGERESSIIVVYHIGTEFQCLFLTLPYTFLKMRLSINSIGNSSSIVAIPAFSLESYISTVHRATSAGRRHVVHSIDRCPRSNHILLFA